MSSPFNKEIFHNRQCSSGYTSPRPPILISLSNVTSRHPDPPPISGDLVAGQVRGTRPKCEPPMNLHCVRNAERDVLATAQPQILFWCVTGRHLVAVAHSNPNNLSCYNFASHTPNRFPCSPVPICYPHFARKPDHQPCHVTCPCGTRRACLFNLPVELRELS